MALLKNVEYKYRDKTALKNINLRIKEQECVFLLGENGAGKSTLMLILAALYTPTGGEAYIFGKNLTEKITKDLTLRKKIGIVFQDPDVQLFSPTVYDDVAFAPRHMTQDEDIVKSMVEYSLKKMGVWHLQKRHPYELSEGEKKRVAIATVLSYNPVFILLDEPTANLDGKGKKEFVEILGELKKEGKTLIVATHEMRGIEYADRIIIMKNGVIKYDGSPSIIKNKTFLEEMGIL